MYDANIEGRGYVLFYQGVAVSWYPINLATCYSPTIRWVVICCCSCWYLQPKADISGRRYPRLLANHKSVYIVYVLKFYFHFLHIEINILSTYQNLFYNQNNPTSCICNPYRFRSDILTMTSSYPNQPIAPNTSKPTDYTAVPAVQKSIARLDSSHHEYDVGRAVFSMLQCYFPVQEDWTIVPEFLEPGGKRPDLVIEKFLDDPSLPIQGQFVPKIAVELKSASGKTLIQALAQVAKSVVELAGDEVQNPYFAMFIIVVKGRLIGFFEYHNDRSHLAEEGFLHYRGAVPFNRPQQNFPTGRPTYRGTGTVPLDDEYFGGSYAQHEGMKNAFLDIGTDSAAINLVLNWMKHNGPLVGPA